jgi:hypothetical protein
MPQTYTVYDAMKFPDYEFQEYPKHVYPNGPDKPYVEVRSEAEEAEAMGSGSVVREEEEQERLVQVATIKGVKIDKRWGVKRLRDEIKAAGFDPDLDPKA